MKILVVVNSHFGYDGISNVATNYYIYQDHSKLRMDLMTINEIPAKLKQEIQRNGDNHYIMPQRNKNPFSYVFSLSRLIRKNRYDAVHVHGNSNTIFIELVSAMLGGCKTRIAHSHNTKCDHPVINKILSPLFRLSYTDGFACGREAGEWLFGKNKVMVIENGVDLERFTLNLNYRNSLRKAQGVDNRIVIGHVGRFSIQKNHTKLISIFSSIQKINPNVTLMMWGEGELLEDVKKQANEVGGDIRFMGTSNEIEKCLHAVDIIVFPSLFEGLPLFLVEAQAMGLPCLLSDTVSPMTKITDFVYYEPLDASDDSWAKKTLDIVSKSKVESNAKISHTCIREAGYDIRVKANDLVLKYQQLINKNNG